MNEWIQQGMRVDIELSVALEIGVHGLQQSDDVVSRKQAMAFNLHLWRTARLLAPTAPLAEDCRMLIQAAAEVESGRLNQDQLAALNMGNARRLAGRAATQGALGILLAQWRTHRATKPEAEFGAWLLDRLDFYASLSRPLMAA